MLFLVSRYQFQICGGVLFLASSIQTVRHSLSLSLMKDYGILDKVSSIVTDNGSNFVKAFRVYKEPIEEIEEQETPESEAEEGESFDYSSADDSDMAKEVTVSTYEVLSKTQQKLSDADKVQEGVEQPEKPAGDKDDALTEEEDDLSEAEQGEGEETRIVLPNHIRCASHTLSLLASSDFEKAIQANSVYKLAYRRVLHIHTN